MKLLNKIKKYWWIFLIFFVIGAILVNRSFSAGKKETKAKQYTVVRRDLVDELSLSGEIDAEEKVELRFQTSGLLTWVGVKEGDWVKKYQAIASLDKRELQNSMSKLLNTYSKTRWDFEQAQADNRDWQTDGMTDEARETIKRTLDKYQFDLNNSVLSVESQNLALRYATLTTPIEGLVTKIDAPFAGQNITPATATFEIINPKTVFFSALADQTEVTKFKIGQEGKLVLDAFGSKIIEGKVSAISFTPKSGETGTVYQIKLSVELDNSDYSVRMGMTGDMNFVFKEVKNVLSVPTSYIKSDKEGEYVLLLSGKEKVRTSVKTGETIDGNTEIISGINEKDVIYSN